MFKINFDRFPYDIRKKSGRAYYTLNKTRPGSGVTASPIISLIMNLAGIKDCNIKVKNQRDLLVILMDISSILISVRSFNEVRRYRDARNLNL